MNVDPKFARLLGLTADGRPLRPVVTLRLAPAPVVAASPRIGRTAPFAHIAPTGAPLIAHPTTATPVPGAAAASLAAQIIAAGKKRRAELPPRAPDLSTEAGRIAAAILRAGRKARGERENGL